MSHISATHLPICVIYLQLDACEICPGHSGCSQGVQNSNWKIVIHVRVAISQCIYLARI